jgi:hypothetical protein
MRAVCGRLESRYGYSNTIVYSNFPFPYISQRTSTNQGLNSSLRSSNLGLYAKIETAAQRPMLYSKLTKPLNAYTGGKDSAARIAFLFELSQKLTAPLMETETLKKPKNCGKISKVNSVVTYPHNASLPTVKQNHVF